MPNRKLTLDDIADQRAYERERDQFRDEVIALKRVRRVPVGELITLLFENRTTIRFQIQEMARVERIMSDSGIQAELDVYNPLIPEPGHLSATLFVELTTSDQLREWLPKLVGVERAVELRLGDGDGAEVVKADVDPAHAEQLTRDDVTASVHYVSWTLTDDQVARFEKGPVRVAVDHPSYQAETTLGPETAASLLEDLGDA